MNDILVFDISNKFSCDFYCCAVRERTDSNERITKEIERTS